MLSQDISIIRNFTVSLDETNHRYSAGGYVNSNKEMTKHEVHVWYIEKDGATFYDFPYAEEEDGSWYCDVVDNGKDITNEDIIKILDDIVFHK